MSWIKVLLVATALGCASCGKSDLYRNFADGGPVDGGTDPAGEYDAHGIDMLFVVDDSWSMEEEQELLSDHVFDLVGGLMLDIDSVRVGVVSTDLGLQWGGHPYEDGDGWPGDPPVNCDDVGDDGELQTYSLGKQISIEGEPYTCPILDGEWAQSPQGSLPNPDLPGQAACLTALGDDGCGWEQSLQSGLKGLTRIDQLDFVRDEHLLVVVFVSDEDDCSVASNELYAVDEIQEMNMGKVNLACGNHPEHLYEPADYAVAFAGVKGGNPNAVLYAAIVGVPEDPACQGRGDQLGDCLAHDEMQLEEVEVDFNFYTFAPACERLEGNVEVTQAKPARRFVELATTIGENAYVHSICDDDWGDALDEILQMIDDELGD